MLKRNGQGRLPRPWASEPERRYQRSRAGELVHVDIKKLGRIARPGHRVTGSRASAGYHRARFEQGWEYVHVCVDDATRLAYVEMLEDERPATCIGFLERAIAHLASYGIQVERVMTDNGNPYRSKAHALACQRLGSPPSAHRALHAAHQRQGRALHPDADQRLGLRRHLRLERRTHRRTSALAPHQQPPPATPIARPQTPRNPPRRRHNEARTHN